MCSYFQPIEIGIFKYNVAGGSGFDEYVFLIENKFSLLVTFKSKSEYQTNEFVNMKTHAHERERERIAIEVNLNHITVEHHPPVGWFSDICKHFEMIGNAYSEIVHFLASEIDMCAVQFICCALNVWWMKNVGPTALGIQ